MYKVSSIAIDGFWLTHKANASFNESVNIVIGKNGTGKTTFIDILESVLSVDVNGLVQNDFRTVEIKLTDGKGTRTIQATKTEPKNLPFPIVKYKIWRKKFELRLIGGEDFRYSSTMKRRIDIESNSIRRELSGLVSLASLSVYRIRPDTELDYVDRHQRRVMSPVDMRLIRLMKNLTQYLLELSQRARSISSELQKSVLLSLLYDEDRDAGLPSYATEFNRDIEEQNLLSAYEQLGLTGHRGLRKRIAEHVEAIEKATKDLRKYLDGDKESPLQLGALDAHRLTGSIVSQSLTAKDETAVIYSQADLFLEKVGSFITDKNFGFDDGDLVIDKNGPIPFSRLSSGEKQLLILLIEALLQRQQPYVFIADEPELSLHVSWQRRIIPTITELNPNAQVIVATHSPEVAGRYGDSMIDMEEILNAGA